MVFIRLRVVMFVLLFVIVSFVCYWFILFRLVLIGCCWLLLVRFWLLDCVLIWWLLVMLWFGFWEMRFWFVLHADLLGCVVCI